MKHFLFCIVLAFAFPALSQVTNFSDEFPAPTGPLNYEQTLKMLNEYQVKYNSKYEETKNFYDKIINDYDMLISRLVQDLNQCKDDSCKRDKMNEIQQNQSLRQKALSNKTENLLRLTDSFIYLGHSFVIALFKDYLNKTIPKLIEKNSKFKSGYVDSYRISPYYSGERLAEVRFLDKYNMVRTETIFFGAGEVKFGQLKAVMEQNPETETTFLGLSKIEMNKALINGGNAFCPRNLTGGKKCEYGFLGFFSNFKP